MTNMAFDRSLRSKDVEGRLHLESSNISKATVSPYYGREIPRWRELGLDPERIYNLFRDPAELARGAPTFNRIPILSEHVPVDALDHRPDLVIGATGSDSEFIDPYLANSLVIWVQEFIDKIEAHTQKELSSAYRYRADMTPGQFNGLQFDGIMRDIVGNHVALVQNGRAGPDVVIGDSAPMTKLSKVKAVLAGKLAQDADIDALAQMALDAAEEKDEDDKPAEDEEESTEEGKEKPAEDEEDDSDDKKDKAMDSRLKLAEDNAVARVHAIYAAREAVRPLIGEIKLAVDSAEAVYKMALDQAGVVTKGVHPSAYAAMVGMLAKPAAPKPAIAQDSAGAADYAKRFPSVPRKA